MKIKCYLLNCKKENVNLKTKIEKIINKLGLPKIHKDNIPLCPILSHVGTSTYNLSNFLSQAISKILDKSQYHVTDSWEFYNFIIKQIVPTNHIWVSFDFISLLTNMQKALNQRKMDETERAYTSYRKFFKRA